MNPEFLVLVGTTHSLSHPPYRLSAGNACCACRYDVFANDGRRGPVGRFRRGAVIVVVVVVVWVYIIIALML